MPVLRTEKNIILACQISGMYDVNRNQILTDDDYSVIKSWCESIVNLDLQGVIFHNNYSKAFCDAFSNQNIQFKRIDYIPKFNPNVFRYLVYDEFLKSNHQQIDNVFLTDISDVIVIKNPFETTFFKTNPNFIFCGDEPKVLENEWMKNHSEHLRTNIKDYAEYEEKYKHETLLNCGIIGGNIGIMSTFIEKLSQIHRSYNFDNKTAYTGDMGAFNYLIRTQFNHQFFHGFPINTEFKAYQTQRHDCWFRHK